MVQPEPGHLLLQLVGRIEVAQQRAGGGFAAEVGHGLLIGLLGGLLLVRIGKLGRRLVLGVHLDHQIGHGGARDRQGVDLRLRSRGRPVGGLGMELTVEPGPRAHRLKISRRAGRLAPGEAIEEGKVMHAERPGRVGPASRGEGAQRRREHQAGLGPTKAHGGGLLAASGAGALQFHETMQSGHECDAARSAQPAIRTISARIWMGEKGFGTKPFIPAAW